MTDSQLFLQALRHWNGRSQTGQTLLGSPDFIQLPEPGAYQ